MDEVIKLVAALWDTGILSAVTFFVAKYIGAHTKDKNLQLMSKWALQVVQYAETYAQVGGEQKKRTALMFLTNRLNANKLGYKFSTQQIDAAIELAVKELKGSN
ncbi:phage holin [Weissella coleopterorum]|uniref:Phage holin n=1 Tax=Weissella coleopterorum TaxID=2714949 RepID=A0A6G8AZR7_9LACO|nr:phage holin [Weissella coleopterorum]QIL50558.1 phage holin [Weissella coleopterorum]